MTALFQNAKKGIPRKSNVNKATTLRKPNLNQIYKLITNLFSVKSLISVEPVHLY